jgi:phosphoglycolate phosphatase
LTRTGGPRPCGLVVGFDLDLTLVDSHRQTLGSYLAAFAQLGGPAVTEADLIPHLGLTLAQVSTLLAPDLDSDEVVRAYRAHYDRPGAPPTEPMPGAATALAAVHEVGGRSLVVSAKQAVRVRSEVEKAGLADRVDALYGDLFGAEKADALIAEHADLYVGDHPGDMAAAARASCTALGVTTGSNDAEALLAAGAHDVIDSLEDFPGWLTTWLAGPRNQTRSER